MMNEWTNETADGKMRLQLCPRAFKISLGDPFSKQQITELSVWHRSLDIYEPFDA
jgi:hypothetical protein